MPAPAIAYFISGHGFGHARRSALVIAALLRLRPDLSVHVCTTAPRHALAAADGPALRVHNIDIDSGAVEDDPLHINPLATLQRAQQLLDNASTLVAEAASCLARGDVRLVLSDIPFLAADVAEALHLPCWAITSFTWDWIYEPFVESHPRYRPLLQHIADSYARMHGLFQFPFGGCCPRFPRVQRVPMIAGRSSRPPADVLRDAGIAADDRRPRILVGMRGGVSEAALLHAASQSPQMLFLCPRDCPDHPPDNLRCISLAPPLAFDDLVAVSDVVISKLGYSIVADCLAAPAALLWPPRTNFREDPLFARDAGPYLRHRPIPVDRFLAGDWREDLLALLHSPAPAAAPPLDGADVCARLIAAML